MHRIAAAVLIAVLALTHERATGQAPAPPSDEAGGDHCACSTGICPISPNGRGCSCGCMLKADEQSVRALASVVGGAECRDGKAAGYPCREIDLLAFMPLAEIGGGRANDIWGWTDPDTGREYAIVGRSNGTAFVDVTDPAQPVFVGNLPTQTVDSSWRDMKVYADHVFIVSEAAEHGMQVFDLRQLRAVDAPPVTFTPTAHYAAFGSAHNIAIDPASGFAYAVGTRTCGGGLHMVNVQDPRNPRVAGCYALDGYTHDAHCVAYAGPDRAHAGREICFGANEDTLTIVDVSDKHFGRELARRGYDASAYTHQGWLTDDHRYFLVDDEGDERAFGRPTRTFVWDVSDLEEPFVAAIYEGPVAAIDHNLYIRGNLAYEANYRSGLRMIELNGLSSGVLREVGFFDVYPTDDAPQFNGAWSVYPFFASRTVLVSGIEQGLFVVKPRRTAAGTPRGLTLTLVPTNRPAAPGGEVIYVASVTNHGPDRAGRVQLTMQMSGSAAIVSAGSSRGTCTTTALVTCDLGALPSGTIATATVTARPTDRGELIATGRIVSDPMVDDVSDNIVTERTPIEPARRELVLRQPIGGETFRPGRAATIQWTLRGTEGGVRVELSRDDGRTWTTIADDTPNVGFHDWIPSGTQTLRARVRITSVADPALSATSPGSFTIP